MSTPLSNEELFTVKQLFGVNQAPTAYAFPCSVPPGCSDGQTSPFGLTKRELFAAMAMQALVTNQPPSQHGKPRGPLAAEAVLLADDLLTALKETSSV